MATVGLDGRADELDRSPPLAKAQDALAGAAMLAQARRATATGVKGPKNNIDPLAAGGLFLLNRGTSWAFFWATAAKRDG